MNKELGLILMHIPVGLTAMACLLVHWMVTLVMAVGFLTYEVVEMVVFLVDEHHQPRELLDRAYPEIAGFLIGVGIGAAVIWLLNFLGVDMHMLWR